VKFEIRWKPETLKPWLPWVEKDSRAKKRLIGWIIRKNTKNAKKLL